MSRNLIRSLAVAALAFGGVIASSGTPAQAASVTYTIPAVQTVQYYAPPGYYRGPPRFYGRPYYARPYYARPHYYRPPPYYARPYYGRRYYR